MCHAGFCCDDTLVIGIELKRRSRTDPEDKSLCLFRKRYLYCLPVRRKCSPYINNKVYIRIKFIRPSEITSVLVVTQFSHWA